MTTELYAVIASVLKLPVAQINPEVKMCNTSSWDSLAHMELIFVLEEKFAFQLDPDEIVQMTSVAEIERIVGEKAAAVA